MTTCESCGGEYRQELRHCPHCAVVRLEAEARRDVTLLRHGLIAIVIVAFAFILLAGQLTYAAQRVTSPAYAPSASAPAAPAARSNEGRWLPVNGEVILTLSLPKSEMASRESASARAHQLAHTVLDSIRTASSVAVFDGNSSLICRCQR